MMKKKPMLAHKVGDYSRIKDDDWPLYVQPKLDYHQTNEEYEICAELKREIDIVNDKLSKL